MEIADGKAGVRMTPLEQAIAEQRACRAYLDGPGEDRDGAWAGMKDWLLEECVIRLETNYMPFKKMRELPVPLMCAVRNQTDREPTATMREAGTSDNAVLIGSGGK